MFTLEFFTKTLVSAMIISIIAIISRRSSFVGGLIASLPLTTILALVWMYHDGSSLESMIELTTVIFWMVIPSLVFFVVFPIFLKMNIPFYMSLLFSSITLIITYAIYVRILLLFNIHL